MNSKKLLNLLKQEHRAIGGLYFLTTNILCALILITVLQLSWNSQVVAMADNLAYITSINTSVHSYLANLQPYSTTNPSIPIKKTGGYYNPKDDFNRMIRQAGISNGASTCEVKWDGRKTYVQMGELETSLGTKITPHRQESIIEND